MSPTFILLVLFLIFAITPNAVAESPLVVRYLFSHDESRLPDLYPQQLLTSALALCEKPLYQLERSPHPMLQGRAAVEMADDSAHLNVLWTMTSKKREATLLPVRFPIYKGLLGYRVIVVRTADLPRFSHVKTLQDLKQLKGVQGFDWPDTEILRASGLNIEGHSTTSEMYRLLREGYVDYFPRALIEVDRELSVVNTGEFSVLEDIALIYPVSGYFFTSRQDVTLNQCLLKSLQLMKQNGSFDSLFKRHFGASLNRYDYKNIKLIPLVNPSLEKLSDVPITLLDPVAQTLYRD